MAKVKKLPSGNYRVQVYLGKVDGKQKRASITAASAKEAQYLAAQLQLQYESQAPPSDYTVRDAMTEYIASRTNILSPTTIQGYTKIKEKNLQSIMDIRIKKLTQEDVQKAVNADAKTLKAKTIKNAHGLLASVLNTYKPDMRLRTSLPQAKKKYKELPLPQVIFDAVKSTDIELAALLAMWLSFSMSEIRGIKKSDIKDGMLTLNRSIVDVNNKPIEKEEMKEYERTRRHVVPQYIMELINKCESEYIVPLNAYQIDYRWRIIRKKHGIADMTFHDLRHVSASVMLLLGVPDKYAMERGGWKTDRTMKAVYQNVFTEERKAVDTKINTYFEGIVSPSNEEGAHESAHA